MGVPCRLSKFIGSGGYLGKDSDQWPTGLNLTLADIEKSPLWESWMGDPPDGDFFMQLYRCDKNPWNGKIEMANYGWLDGNLCGGVSFYVGTGYITIGFGMLDWPEGESYPGLYPHRLYFFDILTSPWNQTKVGYNTYTGNFYPFNDGSVTLYAADAVIGQPSGWWESELVPVPRLPDWTATMVTSDVFTKKRRFLHKKSKSQLHLCME